MGGAIARGRRIESGGGRGGGREEGGGGRDGDESSRSIEDTTRGDGIGRVLNRTPNLRHRACNEEEFNNSMFSVIF